MNGKERSYIPYDEIKNSVRGTFVKHRYCLKKKLSLEEIPFRDAMRNGKKSFLSEFRKEKVAISVWTTPKRTKTPPWGRLYNTLPHEGKKITIIPVQASYGRYGDANIIQPSTFSWITAIADIYVIVGMFTNADAKGKNAPSANAKTEKKSTEGKTVFTMFKYDLDDIENQINQIISKNPEIQDWNNDQLKKIPTLLERATVINKELGAKLSVEVQNFRALEGKIQSWKQNFSKYLSDKDKESISAQNREFKSEQKLEKVPGKKGKIDIDVPGFPELHLTADSMEIDTTRKIIQLLEGKNTQRKLNHIEMVLEQHVKLMLFFNTDFMINNDEYDKELISYLTGNGTATKAEIDAAYTEIIQDCDANKIKFVVDNGTSRY